MSNFTYLKTNWPDLYATALEAEQNVNSAPRTSCFYTRRLLEIAVKWLFANDSCLRKPYSDNLGVPPIISETRTVLNSDLQTHQLVRKTDYFFLQNMLE